MFMPVPTTKVAFSSRDMAPMKFWMKALSDHSDFSSAIPCVAMQTDSIPHNKRYIIGLVRFFI